MPPIAIAGAAALALLALWIVPQLQMRRARRPYDEGKITLSDLLKAENDRRSTLAQIVGGLAVLTGLYFTSQTLSLQQAGQLTDRINKAVEQLGSDKPEVTLGGIHQIGRIAVDSKSDRWPLLHVLTSFVEERRALKKPAIGQGTCDPDAFFDASGVPDHATQAVVDVFHRQVDLSAMGDDTISIVRSDLRNIDFDGTKLGRAQLAGDDLSGAVFVDASLSEGASMNFSTLAHANLRGGHFSGVRFAHACLVGAEISGADFSKADMEGADLRDAFDAGGVDLTGASLRDADLRRVDLSKAKGLTREQLGVARTDCTTRLPDALADIRKGSPCPR